MSDGEPGPVVVVMSRGGQGRVVMDTVIAAGYEAIGILDDSPEPPADYNGVPVLGPSTDWAKVDPGAGFVLAIGQAERLALGAAMLAAGRSLPAVVHPNSFVSASATLGNGVVVLSGCTINANAELHEFVIVNANCSVDHDCVLERGSQLGPGVTFPGVVRVGEMAFVGAGAVSLPGKQIGARAVVGAGTVVTKDVPPGATVAGNPGRVIER